MDLSSRENTYSLMGLSGLEPPTSRLSGVRSNRLSYKPSVVSDARKFSFRMETKRFELSTPCLQGRCSPNWATSPFEAGSHLLSHTVSSAVPSAA